MKILVTVKRVEDYESKIKVKPDGSWIQTDGVNYKANPFDDIGLEEALRLKAKHGGEVIAFTAGPDETDQKRNPMAVLRNALAVGADRAIFVKHPAFLDSDAVARLLAKIAQRDQPDLILMGKQAVDSDANQTGQLLAEYLGWGQATFASKLESLESESEKKGVPGIVLTDDKKAVQVWREVDGGLEQLEVSLPAVVTCDLRLVKQLRYAKLPDINKAKLKPVESLTPEALGVDVAPRVKVVKVEPPPARKAGIKVADVAALVDKLKNEAKVL
jgi:electron transfer flavoprotein beta subunit